MDARTMDEPSFEKMLITDNARLRSAGSKLAQAALRVISEFDGCHRLALAVAEFTRVLADEGGRSERSAEITEAEEVAFQIHKLADAMAAGYSPGPKEIRSLAEMLEEGK